MADNAGGPSIALGAEAGIAGQTFRLAMAYTPEGMRVGGEWLAGDTPFPIERLAGAIGLESLPGFLRDFLPEPTSIRLSYHTGTSALSFVMGFGAEQSAYSLALTREGGVNPAYALTLTKTGGVVFFLGDIPILGGALPGEAALVVKQASARRENGAFTFGFDGELRILSTSIPLASKPALKSLVAAGQDAAAETPPSSVKWFSVGKSFKLFRIERIGFEMGETGARLYVDAGFTIAMLSAELYGLWFNIPLGKGSFDCGLAGLLVSFDKPPIKISGGLYKDPRPGFTLYNGKLELKISKFSFVLLGSYGEIETRGGDKLASFFAFLLIQAPIGGPGCFFITGLALGFGVNRAIRMPALEEVPSFPFVQAAMGSGGLSKKDTPSAALDKLSEWVTPAEGAYFAAAGVKFTSYGVATSFAVLIVEFGARMRLSLLGRSVITMPPNQERSSNPLMYAELSLRAVFDFDEGHFEVLAALTGGSYLLDTKCRLQGGFLFCAWSKGERKGEFMISLGGCHHPLFRDQDKYPKIDKLGINWQIAPSLSMKGSGYLAVTHACVMAGCDVNIDYHSGSLHAWLYASASFYMQWKPLFYDVKVGISVGVKYSIFKLELSCDLHLWGPEFSGNLRVKIWFVSFTIAFGAGASQLPPLDWNGFADAYLPKAGGGAATYALTQGNEAGPEISSISVTGGVIRDGIAPGLNGKPRLVVRASGLRIETRSAMPCTAFTWNGGEVKAAVASPAIAPMRQNAYRLTHAVTLLDSSGKTPVHSFTAGIATDTLSSAVWGQFNPAGIDVNAKPVRNLGVGLDLCLPEGSPEGLLPPSGEGYRLSALEDVTRKAWRWSGVKLETRTAARFTGFTDSPKHGVRLGVLSAVFGTMDTTYAGEIRGHPADYYWSDFITCQTGTRVRE